MGETPMRLKMEAQKIAIKFYAASDGGLTDHDFVPVLHTWIQNRSVPGHMLIDVADYSHVKDGPGTLLVAHEANIYLDRIDGQLGLTYSRKQPFTDTTSFQDRLTQSIVTALQSCAKLEEDPKLAGRLKFRTDEMVVFINDRLLAPNTPETFNATKFDIENVARTLFAGANVELEHYASAETVFEVHVRSSESTDLATLLGRVGANAAV